MSRLTSRRMFWLGALGFPLTSAPALAQHEGHHPAPMPSAQPAAHPLRASAGINLSVQELQADPGGTLMRLMSLQGSGTSLQPESSPMRATSWMAGDWLWSVHGNMVGAWNGATGGRGYGEGALSNWAMAMGARPLGPGVLTFKTMGSLEFLTLPPGGPPQLFQTGETFGGRALIDRQHPHDLFIEFALRYTLPLSERTSLFVYGGPVGEPGLGPNTFMHRVSAADNALAPLGHHLQDSTHIAMGVLTAGAQHERWQLEGSIFNGREPDENRWDIERGALDSYSARLSVAPTRNWTLQVSSSFLTQPEALEQGDAVRTTASFHHNLPFGRNNWSTGLVWGQNREFAHTPTLISNGYLLESALGIGPQDQIYGRFEAVDKIGLLQGVTGDDESLHRVHALTLGACRGIGGLPPFDLGVGGDVTLHAQPADLASFYGATPVAYRIYLRLRPPRMGAMRH